MSIKIVNPAQPTTVLWEKSLRDADEYRNVKAMCRSGRSISAWQCWIIPARTNTWRNFAEDFFFPQLYHASKVSSTAQRVIQNLVYFLVDVLTLPIRVFTCIPRAIYNALQPKHPFLTYLKNNGIDTQLIDAGHVRVHLKFNFGESSTFQESIFGQWRTVTSEKGEIMVHFVTVPEMIFNTGNWTPDCKSDGS